MRLIDADTLKDKMIKCGFHAIDMTVTEFVEDMLPTVEAIPKDQYEHNIIQQKINALKAETEETWQGKNTR